MVFNATFDKISVISWRSPLLVEEIGVPRENHRPVASHSQTLPHNVVSSKPPLGGGGGFKLTTLVVKGAPISQVVGKPTTKRSPQPPG